MLLGVLFTAFIFLSPELELEAEGYIQDACQSGEYYNAAARIVEMNNGVTFHFRKADGRLLEFDLTADELSYDRITVGKEMPKTSGFIATFHHGNDTVCHIKKYEDNSILRVITKGGIVKKISRMSRKITTA